MPLLLTGPCPALLAMTPGMHCLSATQSPTVGRSARAKLTFKVDYVHERQALGLATEAKKAAPARAHAFRREGRNGNAWLPLH